MEMSQEFDKIAPAFVKAQATIDGAIKNQQNNHLKNSYADLSAVIDACKPALSQQGIAILQTTPTSGDIDTEGSVTSVTIITTLMHESGQWFRSSLKMPLTVRTAQGVGSAITYGRRYALAAMCGVAQVDDDANEVSGTNRRYQQQDQQEQQPRKPRQSAQKRRQQERQETDPTLTQPISDDRLAYLEELILVTKSNNKAIASWAKVDDLKNLMNGKYARVRDTLEQKAMDMKVETLPVRPAEDREPAPEAAQEAA